MLFQYILKLLKTKSDIINLLSLSEFTPFNKIVVDKFYLKKENLKIKVYLLQL